MTTLNNSKLISIIKNQINTASDMAIDFKPEKVLFSKSALYYNTYGIDDPSELSKKLLTDFYSSSGETKYGNFIESVARDIANSTYGSNKTLCEGLDLDFVRDGTRVIMTIKHGPKWANSTSLKKQHEQLLTAAKIHRTGNNRQPYRLVEGCCTGSDNKIYENGIEKICGANFWKLISGDPNMMTRIISAQNSISLDDRVKICITKEYNEHLSQLNDLICKKIVSCGKVDYRKWVEYNSNEGCTPTGQKKKRPRA